MNEPMLTWGHIVSAAFFGFLFASLLWEIYVNSELRGLRREWEEYRRVVQWRRGEGEWGEGDDESE